MTHFYLIRHAESVANTHPELVGGRSNHTPLSERGIAQARRLGRFVREHGIVYDSVLSSPAKRTLQTARHAFHRAKRDLVVLDKLQEISQGSAEGRPRIEVYTPEVLAEIGAKGRDFHFPGGESTRRVGGRMLQCLSRVADWLGDEATHMVVTHGTAIKSLVAELENRSQRWIYEAPMPNASLTHVEISGFSGIVHDYARDTQDEDD